MKSATHVFSQIQNQIISRLKNAKSLRYSELQPENIPNDLFNYHLQFLVKKGYLVKSDEGYSLSDVGVKHVADYNPATDTSGTTNLFKVNVLTVVSRINNGKLEILNQLRKSNPSYGKIGVMGGVVRKEETIEEAAIRKLKAETGLEATTFKLVGIQRRIMYIKGELFSDVLFPIAYADECFGKLNDTEYGHNMWVDIDQAIQNEQSEFDSIKKLPDVLRAIKDGSIFKMPFFYEEDVQSGELV